MLSMIQCGNSANRFLELSFLEQYGIINETTDDHLYIMTSDSKEHRYEISMSLLTRSWCIDMGWIAQGGGKIGRYLIPG